MVGSADTRIGSEDGEDEFEAESDVVGQGVVLDKTGVVSEKGYDDKKEGDVKHRLRVL